MEHRPYHLPKYLAKFLFSLATSEYTIKSINDFVGILKLEKIPPGYRLTSFDIKDTLSGLRQFLATKSPLKTMKNAFYFVLKPLFVLKILRFLSWLFGHVEKHLIRKIRLISKFMTSQPGKQTIAMHLLPNISRSKGNQTMKFGQLAECNMRNIFMKNHTQNVVEKLFSGSFLINQNWANLWINSLKFYTVCFHRMASWGLLKYIGTKLQSTCSKLFQKIKKGLELVPCLTFCIIFLKKYFSCSVLLTYRISLSVCLYFVRYWATYVLIACEPSCGVINSGTNLIFLIKPVFFAWPKSQDKI